MIGSYGYVASKLHKDRIIMVGWGPDLLITPFKSIFHRAFLKKVLNRPAQVVVDSYNMKEVLKGLGVEESRIKIFPYGPERDWYIYPDKSGISRPVKIVSHRKLETEYDPFTILNSLKYLKDNGMDFQFVFASFGSLKQLLEKTIREYGLDDRVYITGFLPTDKLIKMLLKSDIYVSASLYDSTSVSLLEAMAVGLYPVVSDVEANMEWITHKKNGLIFKKGDYISLAECLIKLINMEDLEYKTVINYNYEVLKTTGNFEDNVLKTVESLQ